jgi:hypothetical protein
MSHAALSLYAILLCAVLGALFGFLYHRVRPVVAYMLPIGCLAAAMLVYEPAHLIVVMLACSVVMPFMMARGLNVARRRSGMRAVLVPQHIAEAESGLVLVHADGPCANGQMNTPLVDGFCPVCEFAPDMQSTAFINPNGSGVGDTESKGATGKTES